MTFYLTVRWEKLQYFTFKNLASVVRITNTFRAFDVVPPNWTEHDQLALERDATSSRRPVTSSTPRFACRPRRRSQSPRGRQTAWKQLVIEKIAIKLKWLAVSATNYAYRSPWSPCRIMTSSGLARKHSQLRNIAKRAASIQNNNNSEDARYVNVMHKIPSLF